MESNEARLTLLGRYPRGRGGGAYKGGGAHHKAEKLAVSFEKTGNILFSMRFSHEEIPDWTPSIDST